MPQLTGCGGSTQPHLPLASAVVAVAVASGSGSLPYFTHQPERAVQSQKPPIRGERRVSQRYVCVCVCGGGSYGEPRGRRSAVQHTTCSDAQVGTPGFEQDLRQKEAKGIRGG